MASTETLRLLVTVKVYPAVGKKHGEAVCVGGIDVDSPRWVRLYPVPFRDLPNPNRFKKYETIELQVRKAATDQRPESYTPNTRSIKVVRNGDFRLAIDSRLGGSVKKAFSNRGRGPVLYLAPFPPAGVTEVVGPSGIRRSV